jgi:hypothetical protein
MKHTKDPPPEEHEIPPDVCAMCYGDFLVSFMCFGCGKFKEAYKPIKIK